MAIPLKNGTSPVRELYLPVTNAGIHQKLPSRNHSEVGQCQTMDISLATIDRDSTCVNNPKSDRPNTCVGRLSHQTRQANGRPSVSAPRFRTPLQLHLPDLRLALFFSVVPYINTSPRDPG